MSGSTAELTVPTVGTSNKFSAPAVARRLAGGRLYLALAGGALVLCALSLLIPSTPSYDPWAWLVWGREIVHLDLHTTGGPTWKPLPVIFTTLFAPFGRAAPDMWLIVARAGAVMAAAMVFKLAWRVVVGLGSVMSATAEDAAARRRLLLGPALLAGVLATISLSFSDSFITDNALGYSEGLMTALVLIAIDLHLDGRHRWAFGVGFAAALDRPEIWLFWGPYGLWLFWKDPGARKLVIGLFVLIPVLWFVPEYWGSGHFFRGVSRAQHVRSNSPALKPCPFCSLVVDHAWPKVLLRIKAVAVVAVGMALLLLLRRWRGGQRKLENDRDRGLALLAFCGLLGLGWWVLIGIMTQAGFSGNDRYLVLGAALINVAGAAGWGWAALEVGGRPAPTVLRSLGERIGLVSGRRVRAPVRVRPELGRDQPQRRPGHAPRARLPGAAARVRRGRGGQARRAPEAVRLREHPDRGLPGADARVAARGAHVVCAGLPDVRRRTRSGAERHLPGARAAPRPSAAGAQRLADDPVHPRPAQQAL